jgi:hypothetical protein
MTDVQADLAEDLRSHIYAAACGRPRGERARWVMNLEWLNEVRKMELKDHSGAYLCKVGLGEFLLGLPVEVRADGGVPHLVPG